MLRRAWRSGGRTADPSAARPTAGRGRRDDKGESSVRCHRMDVLCRHNKYKCIRRRSRSPPQRTPSTEESWRYMAPLSVDGDRGMVEKGGHALAHGGFSAPLVVFVDALALLSRDCDYSARTVRGSASRTVSLPVVALLPSQISDWDSQWRNTNIFPCVRPKRYKHQNL